MLEIFRAWQQDDDEMLVPHSDFAPVEGPQPMEVAPSETANPVDAQSVDDTPSARFTWTIENFTRLNTKKLYSEIFYVGGYKWRVLIFPKGNNVEHLSMYLDVADSATLPYGWCRYAQFSLSVINQVQTKYTVRKAIYLDCWDRVLYLVLSSAEEYFTRVASGQGLWKCWGLILSRNPIDFALCMHVDTQHQFNARESDWGFTSFMPLVELYDPSRGYLVNDTILVEADVAVRKVVDYWSHDSKKETGYVGLKNQGATCYMNSLLQTLYHIPYFRKAVYHMPTTENDMPSGSIPLALQSLFYKLQHSDTSVATKELTKSFGWDTYDSFMQHDVQELNRVLCEKLEDKMKGTVVEGTIQQLFEGHHMNYIECINVDYKSTRKESFYDLQLDVKGCRDVYASFDKYVEVERLEGDNKYHAEQHGLQDARKGVLFIDFPPVLQLQLKRFEYDFMRDTMVKINDRYEFPLQLDLDRENGKYLSPEADRSVRNLYTLHSVLVHSGGVHGGHYYAYIRPTLSDQWFKFDDERVTKEDIKRALEEQYGGEEELPQTNPGFNNSPFKFTKYSNAYMLVYIRESDKEKVICNVDEKDIAEHLRVARDEDLVQQIGRDIYFDLVDHDKARTFRIQKQTPFSLFKEEVAKEFGIPVQFQRFWLWAKRQNHTYRPNRPLTTQEEAQSEKGNREKELVGKKTMVDRVDRVEDLVEWRGSRSLSGEVRMNEGQGKYCFIVVPGLFAVCNTLGVTSGGFEKEERQMWDNIHNRRWQEANLVKCQGRVSQPQAGEVGQLREVSNKTNNAELKLFLEVEFGQDLQPVPPPVKSKEEILIFLKCYDPLKEELRYVGRLFVKANGKPAEVLTKLNELAGFATDEEIELFEVSDVIIVGFSLLGHRLGFGSGSHSNILFNVQEIKFEPTVMCEHIDKKVTFRGSQLEDGDIICFQKSAKVESSEQCRYPDVPAFLEYVHNRQCFPTMRHWYEFCELGQVFEVSVSNGHGQSVCFEYKVPIAKFKKKRGFVLQRKIRDGSTTPSTQRDPDKDYVNCDKSTNLQRDLHTILVFCVERFDAGNIEYVWKLTCESRLPFSKRRCTSGEKYFCRKPVCELISNALPSVVRFRSLEKPKEEEFRLELSKLHNYDDVVERVACHLGLDDPSKIRLTSHNCYSQQPKPQPIKYRGVDHLSDMLIHYNQTTDIMYYEVLDIPLPELQGLKTLKVAFHHATKEEVVIHTIRLPKQSTVGDVINDLKTKVELSHPNAELRLLEVFYHKIYKIFPLNEKIENINDQYWTLRAEEIPEEEKNLGPHDRLIHIYHFTKDTAQNQVVQNFGEPFFLVIREGETLGEVKVRIQKKLQVPDEEFSKWKFAFLSLGRPEYLQESDIISSRFQRRDVYGAWEQYLGLEHSDNTPKRSYAANQISLKEASTCFQSGWYSTILDRKALFWIGELI
ncbi:hypothetical protein RHSIM_Rhsim09G0140000 [Rhododendron simsii]|uniref:ubiquitinyl hydrolase 1 n=1 Tax=Rhododendron simsii TaxID=118357 RepID=A0A834GG08_RHOSS|nr:hypothetical protein RHSIM_Rhsim09G0140000 [Rhododendron simsii]